jgi:TatD family hydrolase
MHDSHIHLALNPLLNNRYRDLEEFVQAGGIKILTQTTEYTDYNTTIEIVEELNRQFPDVVDLALGIHPTIFQEALLKNDLNGLDIYKYSQKIIRYFQQYFEKYKSKITAIGETGLDYYDMYNHNEFTKEQRESLVEIQKRSFRIQCQTGLKNSLPLSIHARESEGQTQCVLDTLDILAQEGNGLLKGVFHSYTGSINMLDDILNMGFYVGFNAIITYPSGNEVRNILERTPLERILFETDGPFLAVQSERKNKKAPKRYGRPISISEILDKAASIKGVDRESLEEITDQNYKDLFTHRD